MARYSKGGIELERSLMELGFDGKALRDMSVLVETTGELDELHCFIATNTQYKSCVSILTGYRKMRMAISPVSQSEFVTSYSASENEKEKTLCLQSLLKCYIDLESVEYLDIKLHTNKISLTELYKAYEENPFISLKRLILEAESVSQGVDVFPTSVNW